MNGFILTTHADHNPLVQALQKAGVDMRRVDLKQPLPPLKGCLGFYGNLFDEIKNWPELFKLKRQLNRHNVPYVFWNRDAPWHVGMRWYNRWLLRLTGPVDIYLAHSLQDAAWFSKTSHYFPNAAQPGYCKGTNLAALRDESCYRYDVSFIGSIGKAKYSNASCRQEFFSALQFEVARKLPQIRVCIVDIALQSLATQSQIDLIRSSKINLNVGAMCDRPGQPSWGLPERIFGIPAAGGLVISDTRRHLTESFSDGVVPAFDSPQTCIALIASLLNDWDALRALAERQHQEVVTRHTYKQRAQTFMDILIGYRAEIEVVA